jgi:hypothetical protein
MTCQVCGQEIHPDRLEFLRMARKALTCLGCSNERPKVCLTSYDHKTAGHLVIVGTDPEQIRLAQRAYRRER